MSEKGYIHRNREGRWELHFVVGVEEHLDGTQTVHVEKYNDYAKWDMALFAMKKKQKGFK